MSRRLTRRAFTVLTVVVAVVSSSTVAAQQRQPAPRRAPARQPTAVRGFFDVGAERFAAADTFKATLGSSTGVFFGGGGEVVLPQQWFIRVRVSHFGKSGERVFVHDDEVFPLGIAMKVSMTPVEVTGGYRLAARGRTRNMVPYLGAGISWQKYTETSEFADTSENVDERFTGFHALGGIEFRMSRLFALAGEAQWTAISDPFEQVSSAADAFGESNLGGVAFRVRFVVGR
jgi:hypothetical protein